MSKLRALLLIVATTIATTTFGALLVAPPAAAAASCMLASTPPPAPTAPTPGFVLWSPPDGSGTPNTLTGYLGDTFDDITGCATATLNSPTSISVAPGVAVLFSGRDSGTSQDNALFVPWGATSTSGSPVRIPQDVPGLGGRAQFWAGTTSVTALDPVDFAASYASCVSCDFTGSTFTGDPPAMSLPGAPDNTGWNSYGSVIANTGNLTDAILPPVYIDGNVSGYTFDGATLDGAQFIAFAVGTSFRNLRSAVGTQFGGGGYYGDPVSVFDGANLSGAQLSGSYVDTPFRDVTLNGTSFDGANLTGATFAPRPFHTPPSFDGATLQDGNSLQCVSFAGASLIGVSFNAINWPSLVKCTPFTGSSLSLSAFDQVAVQQKLTEIDFTGATLVATSADRGIFAGANLSGANLSGLNVVGLPLDLTGTKLDGATLTNVNFSLAQLAGATLTNVSAAGASFRGATLSGSSGSAANFSGANTNLQGANFVGADVSGGQFIGADLSGADFTGARGIDTDFSGVKAVSTVFANAHLYGNGQAFDTATNLQDIDFTNAVLAGDVDAGGGFDLTGADLTGARFDGLQCVSCNLTGATLNRASFTDAFLPGVALSGATTTEVSLDGAWLYCGPNDAQCQGTTGTGWPLSLGSGEVSRTIPYTGSDLTDVVLDDVTTCPDGKAGSTQPVGCAGHLLPGTAFPGVPRPCSASALGSCPTTTTTVFGAAGAGNPGPLSVAATVPPTWNTAITATLPSNGYYAGFDDGTVRLIGTGSPPTIVAGTAGTRCPTSTAACGDGGPAGAALLGEPSGLAVGMDGSLYIADRQLLRVRKIDPAGIISTIAGTGTSGSGCPAAASAGGRCAAIGADLTAVNGVAVDPAGTVLIADGPAGIRQVAPDGTITDLITTGPVGDVRSVVSTADGTGYAVTRTPDLIVAVTGAGTTAAPATATPVVGTGISGYNGNSDTFGDLYPGTQVQINQPTGLSVDLGGNILFADTGNHLVRAYVPSTTHVIDDLAGVVTESGPEGGFTPDGSPATQTLLQSPQAVAASAVGPVFVVADTGNTSVRQFGPEAPPALEEPEPRPPVVLSCRIGLLSPSGRSTCERLAAPERPIMIPALGTVTVSRNGTVVATGGWLAPARGKLRFLLNESQELLPGSYRLGFRIGHREWHLPIRIT